MRRFIISSENKFTNEGLKEMQSWSLAKKIQVSQARIMEWYQAFDGKVYVSFSGGKDSTVLLDLVRNIYPEVPAVFVDTGLEFPEIRDFVKTKENVVWLKPEVNFRRVVETYGYPIISKEVSRDVGRVQKYGATNKKTGDLTWSYKSLRGLHNNPIANKSKWSFLINAPFKTSDICCNIMKKKTVHTYEKETGRRPYIGSMTVESRQRMTQWLINGCNSFDAKFPSSKPLSFWTEQDVLEYISVNHLPYASVYGNIVGERGGVSHNGSATDRMCMVRVRSTPRKRTQSFSAA